jgi:plasmid stabilization system protein ParE
VTWSVLFSADAERDLQDIHDTIADRGGIAVARRWIDLLEQVIRSFDQFPQRGTARDDLRRGARTVGFRGRVTILFELDHTRREVVILGLYFAGRNVAPTGLAP